MARDTQWRGRRVTEARAWMARQIEAAAAGGTPLLCGHCSTEVLPGQPFAVGHTIARHERPDLTWEPSNWRAEHKRCSDASGQREVIAKARREATTSTSVSSQNRGVRESPPLPISPFTSSSVDIQVRDGLSWDEFCQRAPEWIKPLLVVPADASPPLYISPLPEDATGSYGLSVRGRTPYPTGAVAWIEHTQGITLRWWQRLAIVLQLAHREDGSLVYRELVESAPRRAGKSWRMRGMTLWRLEHGPELFGETQTILHTGSDVAICRQIQKAAWRWADSVGWTVRKSNGKEAIATPYDDEWLVRSQDAVYGYDVCLGLVDEGWDVKPDTVSEGLEPATLGRSSPQVYLTSTAHRRATSLMRGHITNALTTVNDKVLLLVWAAPADSDPADPAAWRAASPYWDDDRHEYIAAKYAKALAGEADPEADDLDPMEGFKAQYLNIWRLRATSKAKRGDPAVTPEVWAAAGGASAPPRAPDSIAVEGWFAEGVAVASAWADEPAGVVSVETYADLDAALAAIYASGFNGRLLIGKSLTEDPAAARLRRFKPMQQRTIAAVGDLTRLLGAGLRHDDSEALSDQVLALRTQPGPDGAVLASKERADAVKAVVWAAQGLRNKAGKPRLILAPG